MSWIQLPPYKGGGGPRSYLTYLCSAATMMHSNSLGLALGLVLTFPSRAQPAYGSLIINDRALYHTHARDAGMCRQRNDPSRVLVVPGPDVVSKFSVCQGRNEFGELVTDTSGSVYCNGTVRTHFYIIYIYPECP